MLIRSKRGGSVALSAIVASAALFLTTIPVRALPADTCIGSQQLQFASKLTAVPSLTVIPFEANGSAWCVAHGDINWHGRGAFDIGSSCDAMVSLTGSATFWLPSWTDSIFSSAGSPLSQSWTYTESTGGSFIAQASFSWLNTGELSSCHSSAGTLTMSTSGDVTYES